MDFDKRLEQAIARGQRRNASHERAAAEQAMSEEELRRRHSQFRLTLSEQIEHGLRQLPDHFPGFRFESLAGERGWGAVVSRDDVSRAGRGSNQFSRLELTVRPFSSAHVLELAAKGTIHNKELYNRTHFQRLAEVELDSFSQMIDLWIIEYAEQYAARQ